MLSWSFAAAALLLVLVSAALPARHRPLGMAALSFAAVGVVWHVPVVPVLGASLAVYGIGRVLPRLPAAACRWTLAATVATVVAALGLVKAHAAPPRNLAGVAPVLGLSYFALKFIQHLVDAGAGRAQQVDLSGFLCSIFFLSTYPAGPIERTGDFARGLAAPPGWSDRALGVERVVVGLGKKFLLAQPLLSWADPRFRAATAAPRGQLLLAVYAFALGLYLDFAAYSDVAIGVARGAGVRVRENFDHPFVRRNLGLLWQHWHMSLTSWLRDFVFVPVARRLLRVTRRPLLAQITGQTATMLACGLWHGVSAGFVLWGAYQAAGLAVLGAWRAWRGPAPASAPVRDALATLATFHFFAFGLVLFACDVPIAALVVGRALRVLP
ncbi:MAG TPA: MBOAT family O-acyltransferase [Candidatus Nitrosopolaris sp.]|nr:MBOAT family O-acyltransferase [Candidatus Nitrosopolaris sp.]